MKYFIVWRVVKTRGKSKVSLSLLQATHFPTTAGMVGTDGGQARGQWTIWDQWVRQLYEIQIDNNDKQQGEEVSKSLNEEDDRIDR